MKCALANPTKNRAQRPLHHEIEAVVASLKHVGTSPTGDSMAWYGIPSDEALGGPMATIQGVGKRLRSDHP